MSQSSKEKNLEKEYKCAKCRRTFKLKDLIEEKNRKYCKECRSKIKTRNTSPVIIESKDTKEEPAVSAANTMVKEELDPQKFICSNCGKQTKKDSMYFNSGEKVCKKCYNAADGLNKYLRHLLNNDFTYLPKIKGNVNILKKEAYLSNRDIEETLRYYFSSFESDIANFYPEYGIIDIVKETYPSYLKYLDSLRKFEGLSDESIREAYRENQRVNEYHISQEAQDRFEQKRQEDIKTLRFGPQIDWDII